MADDRNTSNRGFASMEDDKQRDIASKGGQSVPDEKRSFSKDPQLAADAGRKGGENSHGQQGGGQNANQQQAERSGKTGGSEQQGGNFANDRDRASEAGQKGGER